MTRSIIGHHALLLGALCLTIPSQINAQDQNQVQSQSRPQTVAEAFGAKPAEAVPATDRLSIPVSAEQEQNEIATRQKLNSEQADFAARQIADNEASRRMVEQAIIDRNATIARQQAEQEAAQQAYEAERLRRTQEHDAAMARWRADVAACNAGDFNRCAAQR